MWLSLVTKIKILRRPSFRKNYDFPPKIEDQLSSCDPSAAVHLGKDGTGGGGIIAFHLPRRGSWKRQAYLFLADYPLSCIGDSRAGNASRLLARQRFKGCGCGRSYPAHESGHQCHAETRTNAPGKLHSA